MTNLLAILVSLAMMLTGASAPLAEPVSRTMQVSNLTVRHNDDEVALSPYASMGVMTDGAEAVFDFFIGRGDDTYLPFQVEVSEGGIVLFNDNSNVTLKLDAKTLEGLMGNVEMDEESEAMFAVMSEYFSAYGELVSLMLKPEEVQAIQDKADEIYNTTVDRGEGQPGTVEYNDEIVDVTVYEYDMSAGQLGALTDAIYACDDRLAKFSAAYFKLLKAMPDDSGLNDADSFETLLDKFGNMNLHITESIAESGLNISDMILHITVPGMDAPLEFVIHSVRNGVEKTAEVTGDVNIGELTVSLYLESVMSGRDMQMDMTFIGNPAGAPQEVVEEEIDMEAEAEATEAVEEADEAEEEPDEAEETEEDDVEDVGGEGDAEDTFYFTFDFDSSYDEESQSTAQSMGYALDITEQDIHADFGVDGTLSDDGEGGYQVSGGLDIAAESYGFDFDVTLDNAPIEERIDEADAVALDGFDPTSLLASLSADALNLYADDSVQKLVNMVTAAMENAAGSVTATTVEDVEQPVAEPDDDDDVEIIEDIEGVEPVEMPEMTFGNPQFNWLPEGYKVDNLNVDEEYLDVNCSLVNEETGDSIFVDITNSYSGGSINHYVLNEDGSLVPVEGSLLNEEIGDGYSMYSMDNGTVNISIFPNGDNMTAEDIAHILSELTF